MTRRLPKLLSLGLLLATWALPGTAPAKSYRITSVEIVARVHPDGSLTIEEERTYRFRGRFSYAFYRQRLQATGGLTDIRVSEGGRSYRLDRSGSPGTYEIREDEDEVEIRWHFTARDESRSFRISYRLLDVVRVYKDIAELHLNFVGTGWDVPSDRVQIRVLPPPGVSPQAIRAWAHGPLWGESAIEEDGTVHLWIENLPRRTAFAARILYPPELFPQAEVHYQQPRLQEILDEEARLAEEANARRLAARRKLERRAALRPYALPSILLIVAMSWLLWWFFYRRYGRRPAGYRGRFLSDLPEDPPAVVNYLFNDKRLNARAIVATLLDLARRGFLSIEQSVEERKSWLFHRRVEEFELQVDRVALSGRREELRPFEADLIRFLFDELAEQDRISFEEIKAERGKVRKWFRNWKKLVGDEWGDQSFYERDSVRGAVRAALVQLLMVLLSVYAIVLFGPVAVIALISSLLALGFAALIVHRTPEVEAKVSRWRALKRYLSRYHKKDTGALSASQVGDYLVYAVALGISTQALKALAAGIPEDQVATYLPWYSAAYGGESVASAMVSLTTVASSTMSSAAGVGGGASGAAGGAAGGSGGGAG